MDRSKTRRRFFGQSFALAGAINVAAQSTARAESKGAAGERLFELGTVTYNIAKDWDLDTLLKKCEALGVKAVELRTTHKHGVEPELPSDKRREIRKRFENSPVRLFGLGSTCEFHSPDAAVVKQNIETATKFVELAHDLGAVGVKVRPNGLATKQGIPAETTLTQIGHALQECGQFAEGFGVEIWLEVHGKETSIPANARKIMDACQSPSVGFTWNSNPTDIEENSIEKSFRLLEKNIRCVHLHDLYEDYPYRELFALLREIGYDRFTMAEIGESTDPDRVLKYYRKVWDELSQG